MRKPMIVAEVGANHNGSLDRAMRIVEAAADAGADCVKFQTWTPDSMCISRDYWIDHGPWKGRRLIDLYREAFTPWEWHEPLFKLARERGMIPFSAGFDAAAVDFLEALQVDRHKVASFELVDLPLIRHMASKGKPMILSTGMASADEIRMAAKVAEGCPLTMLKCTSAYPASAEDANLATMQALRRYGKAGVSDHTPGIGVAVAAAALGADMIEKHLTLCRAEGGLDAEFSMEPDEFAQMVKECRRAAAAIGQEHYGPTSGESTEFRRSMWVARDAKAGDPIRLGENVVTARPSGGMLPACPDGIDGVFSRDARSGEPLTRGMFE